MSFGPLKHYYHKYDDYTAIIYGVNWAAQSFTPTSTFTCVGLTPFVAKFNAPTGTLTYSIYLANGSGNPTGLALATTIVDYSGVDSNNPGMPLKGVFVSPVVLTSGIQYVFVISLSAGNATNYIKLTNKTVGDYAGGNRKTSANSGGSWLDTSSDLMFDLWDDSTIGVTYYYSVAPFSNNSRFMQIYRDEDGNSTISSVYSLTGNLHCKVCKSDLYMYTFTCIAGYTKVNRFSSTMTRDAVFGEKNISATFRDAYVSADDYVGLTVSATRGTVILYDNTWTIIFTHTASTGWYYHGNAISDTQDHFFFGGGNDYGGYYNANRRKKSDGTNIHSYWSGALSIYPMTIRATNSNSIGATSALGNCCVKEHLSTTGAEVWSRYVSPYAGLPNTIVHHVDTNCVFVGTARASSVSMFKIDASNGNQLATFDTGDSVRCISNMRTGNLLVSGNYASDGIGSTGLRVMDTSFSVLWRFDANFNLNIYATIEDPIIPPNIIDQSGDLMVGEGEPVTLFVTATGSEPLTYQWYKDGNPVGLNQSTYFFWTDKNSAGIYTCTVSNAGGEDTSDPITLTLTPAEPTEGGSMASLAVLEKLIKRKKVQICELYEITLRTGIVHRFTSHSEDILWGINSALYKAVPITRGQTTSNLSTSVDKMQISLAGISDELLEQLAKNVLRDARVKTKRIWWSLKYKAGMEQIVFDGWVNVSFNETSLYLECTSLIDCLNQRIPRFVYQEPCNHRLYDGFCTVDQESNKISSTVTSDSSTVYEINDSVFVVPPTDPTKFIRGKVHITSGDNISEWKMIYATEDGKITVSSPFNYLMRTGDTFDYYTGCDLTPETCVSRFDNIDHFLGFVYIPPQEEVLF